MGMGCERRGSNKIGIAGRVNDLRDIDLRNNRKKLRKFIEKERCGRSGMAWNSQGC